MKPTDNSEAVADGVIAALAGVDNALREAKKIAQMITERAAHIRAMRTQGLPYRDIVPNEQRPLIVELLTANLELISAAGSNLRRIEAQALHDEGLTMDEIATLFGVSRQRVAALLKPYKQPENPDRIIDLTAATLDAMSVIPRSTDRL